MNVRTAANTAKFVAIMVALVAGATALYIALGSVELLAFVFLAIILLAIIREADYKKWLLALAFAGVAAGWRGFFLWSDLRLYLAEIFVWFGFIISSVDHSEGHRKGGEARFPIAGVILALCALVAVIVGILNSNQMTSVIGQAKAFILFVPAFVLVRRWVSSMEDVRVCIYTLAGAGALIGSLGSLEYFFPQVSRAMPFLFPFPTYVRSNFGGTGLISLAGFSSWGTPVVAVILVPILGLWISVRRTIGKSWQILWYAVVSILVTGLIISGYRSSWLGLLVLVTVVAFFDKKSFLFLLAGLGVLVILLPSAFLDRFSTIWLLGGSGDSSLMRREYTIDYSTKVILENPLLGTGWGSFATYNDWINIAVVFGMTGSLAFVILYAGLLTRLFTQMRMKVIAKVPAPAAFFGGMAGYAVCMTSGAMSGVQPLMMAFWLIFCLAFRYTELLEFGPRKQGRVAATDTALPHAESPKVALRG